MRKRKIKERRKVKSERRERMKQKTESRKRENVQVSLEVGATLLPVYFLVS